MEFNQTDFKIPSPSVDIGINFGSAVGGEIFRPPGSINAQNRPPSVYETANEYIRKSRAVSEAVRQQHRIDSIYERVVGTAPPREVEVLPSDDPREVFSRPTIRSARPPDDIPPDISSVYNRPSTPNTSGARRAVTIDVVPTSAELVQPPLLSNPTPETKPSAIPRPIGRYGLPLVSLAIDTTYGLAVGQPIEQAVSSAVVSTTGGLIGSAVGSAVAGPIGGFIGGIAGGWVGGKIAENVLGLMRPTPVKNVPNLVTGVLPFTGGQSEDVWYYFGYHAIRRYGGDPNYKDEYTTQPISDFRAVGPIKGIRANNNKPGGGYAIELYCKQTYYGQIRGEPYGLAWHQTGDAGSHPYYVELVDNLTIRGRMDGLPDTGGNPEPLPIPIDSRLPTSTNHPGNSDFSVPRAILENRNAVATPTNYAVGRAGNDNGTPRGDAPYWVKPATLNSPSQEYVPSNLGGDLPTPRTPIDLSKNPQPTLDNTSTPNLDKPPLKNQTIPNKISPRSRKGIPRPTGTFTTYGTPTPTTTTTFPNLTKPTPQPTNTTVINAPTTNTTNVTTNQNITNIENNIATVQQNQTELNSKLDKLMDVLKCLDLFDNPNLCDKLKEMTQGGNSPQIQWRSINVPTVVCVQQSDGSFKPQRNETTIQVLTTASGSEILQVTRQFEEQAKIAESACYARNKPTIQAPNVTLGVPEHWRIRPDAKRPQLLVIYATRNLKNKQWGESRWQVSIPHPNFRAQQLKRLRFAPREMGVQGAWAVLIDESLVRVYMSNESKAIRYVADLVKNFVDRNYWPKPNPIDFIQTGRRPGIEKQMVYPFKVELHLEGIVRGKPDDEYYFP